MHGDERPRDRRAPLSDLIRGRGRRRASRRAASARRRRRRSPRPGAATTESIARGVGCGQQLSARQVRRGPRRHNPCYPAREIGTTAERPGWPNRGSRFGVGRGTATPLGAACAARSPAIQRERALGCEREPVRGHRHEHELEPEGAEDGRREDVAERDARPRPSGTTADVAHGAPARRAPGARGRRRRG